MDRPDQVAESLQRHYKVTDIRFGRSETPTLAVANRVELDGVGLHYCRYDAPTEIGFRDMGGFRQIICLSGSGAIAIGGRTLDLDPRRSGIVPPTTRFDAAYGERYEHLVVQFDEAALARQAELLFGETPRLIEALPILESLDCEHRRRSRAIALALARQFDAQIDADAPSIRELAGALRSAFLEEYLSGTRQRPGGRLPRSTSRRLQDYIQANWDRPLTVETVAAETGVSVRHVFATFKQDLGVTPAAYIRGVRLEEARRRLLAPEGDASVIDVALACGFSSLGHFARRYRERFGELPSTTASRRPPRGLPQA